MEAKANSGENMGDETLSAMFNRYISTLQEIVTTDHTTVLQDMHSHSFETFNKTGEDENEGGVLYDRIGILSRDKLSLSELKIRATFFTDQVENLAQTFLLAGLSEEDTAKTGLSDGALSYMASHKAARDPQASFRHFCRRCDKTIDVLDLVQFLHGHSEQEIGTMLFPLLKGRDVKGLCSTMLPNWPGVMNFYSALMKMSDAIHSEKRRGISVIHPNEANFLSRKLHGAFVEVFRQKEMLLSCFPPVTAVDVDLTRYQCGDAPLRKLTEYVVSPATAVMGAFRAVVQLLHYSIIAIRGDGNCFFRSVVRHFHPRIARDWEDLLALLLRQKLNVGAARELHDVGRSVEYAYRGFVVEGVNDSVTMANAGVWADHLQMQKLATMLNIPVWSITFDDMGVFVDESGTLVPGVDYQINPEGADPATYTNRPPILLLYTPSPGHYEVLRHIGSEEVEEASLSEALSLLHSQVGAIERLRLEGERCSSDVLPDPYLVCELFFRLEMQSTSLREIRGRMSSAPADIRPAIVAEIRDLAETLAKHIIVFKILLEKLGIGYTHELRETCAEYPFLLEPIIATLLSDTVVFMEGLCARKGEGPLALLYGEIADLLPATGVDLSIGVPEVIPVDTPPRDLSLNVALSSTTHITNWTKLLKGRKEIVFHDLTVNPRSLAALLLVLATPINTVRQLEFHACTFGGECCRALTRLNIWMNRIGGCTFSRCVFELPVSTMDEGLEECAFIDCS